MAQRSAVNVDCGNAARCTATRAPTGGVDELDADAAVLHRIPQVATQRRPRLVSDPTPLAKERSKAGAEPGFYDRRSTRQDLSRWIRDVGHQPGRQVVITVRRGGDGHPDQLGTVDDADGHRLSVATPHPYVSGQGIGTHSPVPSEVTGMQLH